MATTAKPTNEHLARMLTQVLAELDQVRKAQEQLAADLRRVARDSIRQ